MKHKDLNLTQLNRLARDLAIKTSLKNRIFGLVGDLGAGKTTFTKAFAAKLGLKNVKSPTFTVVNCYKNSRKTLYHIDLYRLETTKELIPLGLGEIIDNPANIILIEWPEKFPKLLKQCHKVIKFEVLKNNLRNVTITNH